LPELAIKNGVEIYLIPLCCRICTPFRSLLWRNNMTYNELISNLIVDCRMFLVTSSSPNNDVNRSDINNLIFSLVSANLYDTRRLSLQFCKTRSPNDQRFCVRFAV